MMQTKTPLPYDEDVGTTIEVVEHALVQGATRVEVATLPNDELVARYGEPDTNLTSPTPAP